MRVLRAATSPIEVLVFGLPEMLRGLLTGALASQRDFRVSEASVEAGRLRGLAESYRPDAVVTAGSFEESRPVLAPLVEENPRLRIFSVARDGHASWKRELRLNTVGLGDISPEELVELIRASAREPLALNDASGGGEAG